MTETIQSLRDDIAFMRALADEGVRPPLLIGPWLMLAGILFGGASLFSWIAVRFTTLPTWSEGVAFIAAMALFMILIPNRRAAFRRQAGHHAPANRAVSLAWMGIGWGNVALAACTFIACLRMKSGLPAMMIPCSVLVMYGAVWTVAAAMTKQRFLWTTAIACYLAAVAITFSLGSANEFLVFAIMLMLVAFVPGCILWTRQPKDVV